MTTANVPTEPDRFEARMAEAAVKEVARHAIAAAVRRNPPLWEDYPDLGEHDWAAIEKEVDRIADLFAGRQEKFDAAYSRLASRAEASAC